MHPICICSNNNNSKYIFAQYKGNFQFIQIRKSLKKPKRLNINNKASRPAFAQTLHSLLKPLKPLKQLNQLNQLIIYNLTGPSHSAAFSAVPPKAQARAGHKSPVQCPSSPLGPPCTPGAKKSLQPAGGSRS